MNRPFPFPRTIGLLLLLLLAITTLVDGPAASSKENESQTISPQPAQPDTRPQSDPQSRASEVVDRSSRATSKAKGEINFDDLKFPIEKDQAFEDEMLTDDVRALRGRKVKLRGYILPTTLYTQTGIERFILVRDNQECCFGPGAALYDCVVIQLVSGVTTDFVTRPVTVTGKFDIDTKTYAYPGGKGPKGASHLAIFRIEGTGVQ